MTDDDLPISYQAAVRGTPVLSSSGATIGTLEHVLEVPEVDVFDGIVIATDSGLRFIDAQYSPSCDAIQAKQRLSHDSDETRRNYRPLRATDNIGRSIGADSGEHSMRVIAS
jgi:hypothetical protein